LAENFKLELNFSGEEANGMIASAGIPLPGETPTGAILPMI